MKQTINTLKSSKKKKLLFAPILLDSLVPSETNTKLFIRKECVCVSVKYWMSYWLSTKLIAKIIIEMEITNESNLTNYDFLRCG